MGRGGWAAATPLCPESHRDRCGDIPACPGDSTCCWGLSLASQATEGSRTPEGLGAASMNDFLWMFSISNRAPAEGAFAGPAEQKKGGSLRSGGATWLWARPRGVLEMFPGSSDPCRSWRGSLEHAWLRVTPTATLGALSASAAPQDLGGAWEAVKIRRRGDVGNIGGVFQPGNLELGGGARMLRAAEPQLPAAPSGVPRH